MVLGMKFVQLLLLIATFNLLFPNTQTAAVSERSGKTYLCGDYLGKMLSELCHGRYNGPRESRIEIESGGQAEEEQLGYEFFSKYEALAMLSNNAKRGIVEECCVKPCSRSELTSYCA